MEAKRPITRVDAVCRECINWRPHVHYSYVGYCTIHNKLTFEDDSCSDYEPIRIDGRRFYWCVTCKTRLYMDEARIHMARGHRVYIGAYVDPDVRDEIYEAH
ncbi:MAG: hypothetical protein GSR85_05985 [Desulfurococcales archaeon]|nr:hypothetical protein [Desulfurococcales archaeon]